MHAKPGRVNVLDDHLIKYSVLNKRKRQGIKINVRTRARSKLPLLRDDAGSSIFLQNIWELGSLISVEVSVRRPVLVFSRVDFFEIYSSNTFSLAMSEKQLPPHSQHYSPGELAGRH